MGSNNVGNAQSATATHLYGLVRDAGGNPLFEDYNNIHPAFRPLLSEEDWQYIKEQQEKQNGDYA